MRRDSEIAFELCSRYEFCMTREQLQAFVTALEQRRLTEAARRLEVSQPTLSRQIQSLERELGVRLLVRTPRGVVGTDAGQRFLGFAREALRALQEGTAELHELAKTPRGPVALGSLPTVGAYLLPGLLPGFLARHPQVRIRIAEALAGELEQRIADGELDLGILNLPLQRQDLVAQKLWDEPFVLIVPRGHRLLGRERVSLPSLAKEPLVIVPGANTSAQLVAAIESRGIEANVVLEADHPESVRRMVERGVGVALLPALVARDRKSAAFGVVDLQGGPRRTVALVHRGERSLTSAARELKRFLVDALRSTSSAPSGSTR
jgi:LysR family transcriptional activator of glutamate synthase operon